MSISEEDVKKWGPWVVGGGLVLIGLWFFTRGTGNSSGIGYATLPAADTSAQAQAEGQLASQRIAATAQGFDSILTFFDNNATRDYNLKIKRIETDATTRQMTLDANTRLASINGATRAAKYHKQEVAISALSNIAGMAWYFGCYKQTKAYAERRGGYDITHDNVVRMEPRYIPPSLGRRRTVGR